MTANEDKKLPPGSRQLKTFAAQSSDLPTAIEKAEGEYNEWSAGHPGGKEIRSETIVTVYSKTFPYLIVYTRVITVDYQTPSDLSHLVRKMNTSA